jgi:hypothetical protein
MDGVLVKHQSPLSAHVHYVPSEKKWQNQLGLEFELITVEYDVDRSINPAGDVVVSGQKSRSTKFCLQIFKFVRIHTSWPLVTKE